jgi:hypothetical protein
VIEDPARLVLEQIAFGLTRPIVAALGERGDAVTDRVYKVRFDRIAICSRPLKKASWRADRGGIA